MSESLTGLRKGRWVMSDDFVRDQEVKSIHSASVEEYFEVGRYGVEKITVVMENGQMAGVPWFAVWKEGKIHSKWNGALLDAVEL